MKKIILLVTASLFLFVIGFFFLKANSLSSQDRIRLKMIYKFASRLYKRDGYQLASFGGKSLYRKIVILDIGMDIDDPFSLTQARKKICDLATEFLQLINSKEEYKDYYIEYPLKSNGICISLSVDYTKRQSVPNDVITYCSINQSRIRYDTKNDITIYQGYRETLDEAIAELEKEGYNYDYLKSLISYQQYNYRKEDDPYRNEEEERKKKEHGEKLLRDYEKVEKETIDCNGVPIKTYDWQKKTKSKS